MESEAVKFERLVKRVDGLSSTTIIPLRWQPSGLRATSHLFEQAMTAAPTTTTTFRTGDNDRSIIAFSQILVTSQFHRELELMVT